jgi:hypothetical protein
MPGASRKGRFRVSRSGLLILAWKTQRLREIYHPNQGPKLLK